MQLPVITDITDGKIFKENTLFGSEENALSVILFQDAFEVVNPLGSAKKKHKILAVYFTLGNIPPQYRSQVESLELALLCREVDFKKYGQEKVFKRLLRDLKLLEETGVQVKGGQIRKGSLACILGDNLGSHTIGGFVESFSSKHYCRYCLLSSAEFQSGEPYALGKCRSPTEYDRCVEHLQQSGEESFEGTKLLAGRKYMIAVDKVVVNHLIADFQSALAYLFATYYVLNIQYPADSCVTLEFIQRCFVGINPPTSGKSRKSSAINPKVLSLLGHIKDESTK
ncbi:hypothetical protein BSL78_06469 [Apostichopus japonicus]|uniref:Uncharacterized protein n=1 Tax=Stichopus japonicus TaxID=307972 RepID=A0A2G8L8L4_STIJA|nr:hypothetical protein BSL78_06469 [Apostichopus japonicus]